MPDVSMPESQSIHPSSIRVWRGFRNADYLQNREGFVNKLADIFIPLTCQAMMPIGLKSYIPTLVDSDVTGMPDEIALVGYSDQQTYYSASHDTVIGRAYGLLHDEVFNFSEGDGIPKSRSGFPQSYSGQPLEIFQPYYFTGKALDWSAISVRVFVVPVAADKNTAPGGNTSPLASLIASLQLAAQSEMITEAILVQDQSYYVLWLAMAQGASVPSIIEDCFKQVQGVVSSVSEPGNVPAMWTEKEGGIPISDNETLNLTLKSKRVLRAAS